MCQRAFLKISNSSTHEARFIPIEHYIALCSASTQHMPCQPDHISSECDREHNEFSAFPKAQAWKIEIPNSTTRIDGDQPSSASVALGLNNIIMQHALAKLASLWS